MHSSDSTRLFRQVGQRLRKLRYENSWKQVDLAAQLDWKLSRSAISYIENGKKSPSIETLLELAKALSVEPAVLFLFPESCPRHTAASKILTCSSSDVCSIVTACEACDRQHGKDFSRVVITETRQVTRCARRRS